MNYYQHNIGDYRRDTAHLSLIEHGIYRQLIDAYYLSELPIPKETDLVCRRLSAKTEDEQKAVLAVLNEFFQLTKKGFIHKRCEAEIARYVAKRDTAKANGIKGGRPPKTDPVILGSKNKADGKLTNNQEPLTNKPTAKVLDENDLNLARRIFDGVKLVAPSAKEPPWGAWANDIRLMREQDKRTPDEIWAMFEWATQDSFWRANILSTKKLREQWVKLEAKRLSPPKPLNGQPHPIACICPNCTKPITAGMSWTQTDKGRVHDRCPA